MSNLNTNEGLLIIRSAPTLENVRLQLEWKAESKVLTFGFTPRIHATSVSNLLINTMNISLEVSGAPPCDTVGNVHWPVANLQLVVEEEAWRAGHSGRSDPAFGIGVAGHIAGAVLGVEENSLKLQSCHIVLSIQASSLKVIPPPHRCSQRTDQRRASQRADQRRA
jgi:hypothetical protein